MAREHGQQAAAHGGGELRRRRRACTPCLFRRRAGDPAEEEAGLGDEHHAGRVERDDRVEGPIDPLTEEDSGENRREDGPAIHNRRRVADRHRRQRVPPTAQETPIEQRAQHEPATQVRQAQQQQPERRARRWRSAMVQHERDADAHEPLDHRAALEHHKRRQRRRLDERATTPKSSAAVVTSAIATSDSRGGGGGTSGDDTSGLWRDAPFNSIGRRRVGRHGSQHAGNQRKFESRLLRRELACAELSWRPPTGPAMFGVIDPTPRREGPRLDATLVGLLLRHAHGHGVRPRVRRRAAIVKSVEMPTP